MEKVGRASLLGYLFLTATGCGGTTRPGPEGTGASSNGGTAAGTGGNVGSGGASKSSGGTTLSSGGTTPSSGGRATGGKGSGGAPGKGGSVGAGGSIGAPDSCKASTDCEWGEIDREITSADACPCLYGCPGYALSRVTVERRKAQYDALCTPGRDGKGQPCGIDDCIVPPPLSCIAQKCVSPRR